jgi:radical SAM protein with 4Fe4S-binding SPASM domain
MPTLNAPVLGSVRVADRRQGRFLLINAETGEWAVTNRPGLLGLAQPDGSAASAALRDRLLAAVPAPATDADGPLFVIYKLTDTCNYRCVYCYDRAVARRKDTTRRDASIRAVLDQALARRTGRIHLLFHGGEPLEELDEIRSVLTRYAPYGASRIQFSVQTNGSLLDVPTVELLNRYGVGLSVSVDGTAGAANALRVVGGRPDPYAQLQQRVAELDGLERDRLGLLMTVGRHNIAGLPDALLRMQGDGYRSVSLSFMQQVGPGARGAAPDELVALMLSIVDRIATGELSDLAVWTLIEWVRELTEHQQELTCMTSPCGAGRSVITVLPSGEVGPCDSIFDTRYYASDIAAYDAARAEPGTRLGELVTRPRHAAEICRRCDVAAHCNGTCPGNAILATGHPDEPAGEECAFHYAWIIELMWTLTDARRGGALLEYCARHVRDRDALRQAAVAAATTTGSPR